MAQLYKDNVYTLEHSHIINAAHNTQTGDTILTSNIFGAKQ